MKVLGIIAGIFTIVYILLNRKVALIFSLSEGLFIIGMIYLFIALIFYVRNVGLFKLISYHRYRKKYMKANNPRKDRLNMDFTHNEDMMEFHEFCAENYKEQWSNKVFLIYAIPLIILSYVLAYFS